MEYRNEQLTYKLATLADLEQLVHTRIIVLRAANKLTEDTDMSLVEQESKEYYQQALIPVVEKHIS